MNHSFINKQNNKGAESTKALSAPKTNTAFTRTLHHTQVHEGLTNSVTSKFFTTYTHKSICIKRTQGISGFHHAFLQPITFII